MRFLRNFLLFFLVFSQPAHAFTVISQWVMPTRPNARFEMLPLERTKPILVGDILYFANLSGDVYAVHRTEGYVFWKVKMPAGVNGALTYGRSRLYVGDIQGNLIALHARDGSEAWRFKSAAQWLSPPAVARDKVLAFNSADELYAFSEATGKEIWHYSERGDEKMAVLGGAGPLVAGNDVYQGFSNGQLASLSLDGKLQWTKRLRKKTRFHDIDMSPYVNSSDVFVATFDGNLYKLDRTTGEIKWLLPVGSYGGFQVEGNRLFFAGLNGQVMAIDTNSQKVLWKTDFEGGVGLTPTLAGDSLVLTTSSDPVQILDMNDGSVKATIRLGAGTLAAPVGQQEGWFYCMSNYGNLYSFEIKPTLQLGKGGPNPLPLPSALHRNFVESNQNKNAS